jgi:hypothetical protein
MRRSKPSAVWAAVLAASAVWTGSASPTMGPQAAPNPERLQRSPGADPDTHAAPNRGARLDSPAAAAPTLASLLARFRASPGMSARFREEKRIALLAKPLVSEGTVHYAPPGRLARHTLTPSVSSVLLEEGTLRFGDGASEERVDLAARPALRAFVESFLQLLAGDRAALERTFVIELRASDSDRWDIVLKPKAAPLARAIRHMTFTGDAVGITRMQVVEASGDEAITTFSEVDARRRYTPAEIQKVFRLPRK